MSTVNRELKNLVEEKWIVGKRGVGMFTIPGAIAFDDAKDRGKRIVGIVCHDGRAFYSGLVDWNLMSLCGLALMPKLAHPRNVQLISGHPEDIALELRAQNLDGLIAIHPSKNLCMALRELSGEGLPVVALGGAVEGVASIVPDHVRGGMDMGAALEARGIRRLLWMSFDPVCREQLAGLRRYFSQNRAGPEIVEVANMGEFEAYVRECAGGGGRKLPDALYVHGETVYLLDALMEGLGVASAGWLPLFEVAVADTAAELHGIARHLPHKEMAGQAAQCLRALFSGEDVSPEYRFPLRVYEQAHAEV